MWPFSFIQRRQYQLRYRAALAVLLGVHQYEQLSGADKALVEAEVDKIFSRVTLARAEFEAFAGWDLTAAYRAVGMASLGITPCIDSLDWEQLLRKTWRYSPTFLFNEFRRYHPATVDAKEFLSTAGLHIPAGGPMDKTDLDALKARYP